MSWPWNGVKGHSQSLRVVSLDRWCMAEQKVGSGCPRSARTSVNISKVEAPSPKWPILYTHSIGHFGDGAHRAPYTDTKFQGEPFTLLMLTDVLADLGHPLPTFRSALPLASIPLSKLSSPLIDHPLVENSFNSFFELHLFSFLCAN